MAKRIFGTKEWSKSSENCVKGCKHACLYCYARSEALDKYHTISDTSEWATEIVDIEKVQKKKFGKRDGTIMFPTAHDITPSTMGFCITFLRHMLEAGNDVLIVSKPHLECVMAMCDCLKDFKDQILFRFTIGALNNDVLAYWEPGAPSFGERYHALQYAYKAGFRTSVSMEPVLDWINLEPAFYGFAPFVTDSIWIGIVNYLDKRVKIETEEDRKRVAEIKDWQNVETYRKAYHTFKSHPLVRWKESIKEALGLELAEEAGLDL